MKNSLVSPTRMPSLSSYLKTEDSQEEYENYSILKHAMRQINEISEITSALGNTYVIDAITFKPRRFAFFETIVTIETEVKIRSEEDLMEIVSDVYKNYIVPTLKTKDNSSNKKLEEKLLEEVSQNILNNIHVAFEEFLATELILENNNSLLDKADLDVSISNYYKEIKKIYNEIKVRINEGSYNPGNHSFPDDHNSITKKIVFDKFYNKLMKEKIRELVNPLILDLIDRKVVYYPKKYLEGRNIPLQRLSLHQGSDRHTFMMTGAPASGKGTSFGMITIDARRLRIEMDDVIKCNTDYYRNLVANEKELGPQRIYHSAYNYDESYIITKMIYKRLKEKIQSSRGCPHILIDSVYPTQEKINLGITGNQSTLHIYCVSVPVEISIARAAFRASETGRYMDTNLLLKSHRDISMDFYKIISNHKGKNIDYVLLDNHVPKDSFPILTEEGDLRTKVIKIHNISKLLNFLSKAYVNISATTKNNLYLRDGMKPAIEHFNNLGKLGFQIDFTEKQVHKKLKVFNPERPLQLRIALEDKANSVTLSSSNSKRIRNHKIKYKSII